MDRAITKEPLSEIYTKAAKIEAIGNFMWLFEAEELYTCFDLKGLVQNFGEVIQDDMKEVKKLFGELQDAKPRVRAVS